jgi:hypothetical protein
MLTRRYRSKPGADNLRTRIRSDPPSIELFSRIAAVSTAARCFGDAFRTAPKHASVNIPIRVMLDYHSCRDIAQAIKEKKSASGTHKTCIAICDSHVILQSRQYGCAGMSQLVLF